MTQRGTSWTELLKQDIETAIQDERHGIAGEEEHSAPTFVSEYSLHQIWNLNSIRKRWDGAGFPPPQEIFASDSGLIKIASILILINWDRWEKFHFIFVGNHDRRDKNLPFTLSALKDKGFLGTNHAMLFHFQQSVCLSTVIEEGRDHVVHKGYRLPFIKESPKQAAGAFGTVTKVHIARNHFRYADSGQLNHEHERILARKCLDSAESIEAYKQEVNNLQILRRNILRHERIMTHLGTLETGHDFNIFFNWADYDLHTFLHSERELNNPFRRALLQEASNLAGALHFLHNHIKDGRKVKCYHMDLKPENILVLDGNHLVGKWMIADFGISAFHPDTGIINMRRGKDDDAHSVHEESKTKARRYRGKCQPPEVDHSWPKRKEGINSKGDIWSYGCILAMVFAFSLRGKDSVAELDDARTGDGLGGEQLQDFFYVMNDMGQMILKPEISDWLTSRLRIKSEWVHRCVDLIQRILHPNLESRPHADVIERELSEISEISLDRKPATQPVLDIPSVGHGPSSPIHKRTPTLGSGDPGKITRPFHGHRQRSSETAISIADDASPTHPGMPSSRRDPKPYPTPTSLSPDSGSALKATDSGRYKIPTESRAYSFVSKKPAIALSICPSAEQIILSFDAGMLSLKLKHVDSNSGLNFDIQLNKNGQAAWKHVHTAGKYLVIRGFNNEPKGNYKHVLPGQPSYLAPKTYADHYCYHLDSRSFKLASPLALLVVLISEQVHFLCDIPPAFQRIGQRDFSLLYDLALSTKGDVALLFSNRLELYNANAERRLDYHIPSRYGSEELKTTFFSRFGSRLIACSWTHWYMWNESMWTIETTLAADSSPQYTGTIQPDSDYGKSRPIIIPFTDQDAFFLYDAEDGTLRLYRAQAKETPRVSCSMICGIVTPDDTGLLFIRAVKRKVFSTPKYVLLHRPIRQDGIGEEQELADVDYLEYRKDYKLKMALYDTFPSDQVIIVSSAGYVQRIQIIDAVHD